MNADRISKIIRTIRESNGYIQYIYTQGDCYNFYLILKSIFDNAKPYSLNGIHVLTKIDNKYYDINGEYEIKKTDTIGCVTEKLIKGRKDNLYKECPVCEEPVMFDWKYLKE